MKLSVNAIVKSAILGTLAFLIMLFEFPLPMIPPFLKIDLSEVPVLLAAFSLGPFNAVLVELIKNALHLFKTTTAGIGEAANFLVGVFYVVPASLIYKYNKTKKGAILGLVAGSLSMVVFASILNYYVLLPLYARILGFPISSVVKMGSDVNKHIIDVRSLIAFGIAPFNAVKAIIVSIVTVLIYKRVSPVLHRSIIRK